MTKRLASGAGKRSGAVFLLLLLTIGCSRPAEQGREGLRGNVAIDGSSTVFPITEAVAEEFSKVEPRVRVTVGIAGTGGGFKRFGRGETDISNASRPIEASEADLAASNSIGYIELPVAYDALSVLVNPSNGFVDSLTVQELKRIWEPGSTVRQWSDIRPAWPKREIHLYGPDTDSGTFDYFTEVVAGKAKASRSDYTASADDNVLVQGISGDRDALGYFGYAYYMENQSRLKLVAIDAGQGPVKPSPEAVNNGTYHPLSRPLFLYINAKAAARPEVQAFIRFYLEQAKGLVEQVGYVPVPDRVYELARQRFEEKQTGSVFAGQGLHEGLSLEKLLQGKSE